MTSALTARGKDMGNTMRQRHGLHFPVFGGTLADIRRRPESTSVRCAQLAQRHSSPIDHSFSRPHWLQAHFQPDKRLAHKSKPPLPPNLSVAPYAAHLPIRRIFQERQSPASPASPWVVALGGGSLSQRFVRTHLIVVSDPTIGSSLLRPPGARSRSRDIGLHFPVHLFVSAVLFGMSRRDKFHLDSQRLPPGAQARQTGWTVGSKGATIVHPNHFRQAIPDEQPHKDRLNTPPLLIGQQPGRQNVPAEQIPHRQRFDPLAVGRSEPAFEIDRPHLIGPRRHRQSRAQQPRAVGRPSASVAGQLPSLQSQRDRSYGRHTLTGKLTTQLFPKFPGSPAMMSAPQTSDPPQPASRGLMGRPFGAARAVAQSAQTLPKETSLPFVASLATDPKNAAHFRKGLLGLQCQFYKADTGLNQRNRFP